MLRAQETPRESRATVRLVACRTTMPQTRAGQSGPRTAIPCSISPRRAAECTQGVPTQRGQQPQESTHDDDESSRRPGFANGHGRGGEYSKDWDISSFLHLCFFILLEHRCVDSAFQLASTRQPVLFEHEQRRICDDAIAFEKAAKSRLGTVELALSIFNAPLEELPQLSRLFLTKVDIHGVERI